MSETARSFDEQAALERVAGDHDLLREIASIYLDTYQQMVQRVREASASGDAEALRTSAHFAKGTLANFEALEATATARELEVMGSEGRLDGAADKVDTLAAQAAQLAEELTDYCNRR